MAGEIKLVAVDRPEVPARTISRKLRSQIVYFMASPGSAGVPPLGEQEYWIPRAEVEKILDEGVIYLVSPLDTAGMAEVEITDEQEEWLTWLRDHRVQHIRVAD